MVQLTQFITFTTLLGTLAQAAPSVSTTTSKKKYGNESMINLPLKTVFCTDSNLRGTCITLPVVNDACVSFVNRLSIL
jgi:hypothetical protein